MDIYNLSLEDFRPFPEIAAPGVYVYLNKDGDPIYVGQSGDVVARARAHARKKWADQIVEKRFVPIADVSLRLIAETVLLLRLFPRHNRAIKLGLSWKERRVRELQFLKSTS